VPLSNGEYRDKKLEPPVKLHERLDDQGWLVFSVCKDDECDECEADTSVAHRLTSVREAREPEYQPRRTFSRRLQLYILGTINAYVLGTINAFCVVSGMTCHTFSKSYPWVLFHSLSLARKPYGS
jgi:hypothetical protein